MTSPPEDSHRLRHRARFPNRMLTALCRPPRYFFLIGRQVHFSGGCLQPEQTLSLISRPHFLQGEQPHVWHMAYSSRIESHPSPCSRAPARLPRRAGVPQSVQS
jgi:hypothetical protein